MMGETLFPPGAGCLIPVKSTQYNAQPYTAQNTNNRNPVTQAKRSQIQIKI